MAAALQAALTPDAADGLTPLSRALGALQGGGPGAASSALIASTGAPPSVVTLVPLSPSPSSTPVAGASASATAPSSSATATVSAVAGVATTTPEQPRLSPGAIAGISLAAIFAGACVIALVVCLLKRRRGEAKRGEKPASPKSATATVAAGSASAHTPRLAGSAAAAAAAGTASAGIREPLFTVTATGRRVPTAAGAAAARRGGGRPGASPVATPRGTPAATPRAMAASAPRRSAADASSAAVLAAGGAVGLSDISVDADFETVDRSRMAPTVRRAPTAQPPSSLSPVSRRPSNAAAAAASVRRSNASVSVVVQDAPISASLLPGSAQVEDVELPPPSAAPYMPSPFRALDDAQVGSLTIGRVYLYGCRRPVHYMPSHLWCADRTPPPPLSPCSLTSPPDGAAAMPPLCTGQQLGLGLPCRPSDASLLLLPAALPAQEVGVAQALASKRSARRARRRQIPPPCALSSALLLPVAAWTRVPSLQPPPPLPWPWHLPFHPRDAALPLPTPPHRRRHHWHCPDLRAHRACLLLRRPL
jgi:hypothetical protein